MAEAPADRRREELAAALAVVGRRVEDACRAAGRPRSEVTVIAVTKTYPASDVRLLAALGVTDIGENRDQEAAAKAAECTGLGLRWHFIGQLQTNKARQVVAFADVIHSVDRTRLVDALSREAVRAGREIGCLIQVSLAGAPGAGSAGGPGGRGGAAPADVPALADAVARAGGLRLDGVMAVAPLGAEPSEAFGRLRSVAERLREDHPSARVISAGMSGDMTQAIAHGATHLRVGTALLGRRTPFVR
ncbi:YggS family pyridoxal phosphate-dependent enzyme [Microbispora corallina]|uniref:Pyridoxal phosphate homeostasis protein n=1 Tax=Microbispora corallina TaxID=83302 RepID=A0ABQ4FQV5_9ACTN|nr:YggS family pyridoxal phosphate-dependent enzyme [Microbispora corallina]GIH37183.1 YggS family pyridoxal phosphate enzyme [Microbispora corallina]